MLTAHDTDELELEAEDFVEEIFAQWMAGHFGARLLAPAGSNPSYVEEGLARGGPPVPAAPPAMRGG